MTEAERRQEVEGEKASKWEERCRNTEEELAHSHERLTQLEAKRAREHREANGVREGLEAQLSQLQGRHELKVKSAALAEKHATEAIQALEAAGPLRPNQG